MPHCASLLYLPMGTELINETNSYTIQEPFGIGGSSILYYGYTDRFKERFHVHNAPDPAKPVQVIIKELFPRVDSGLFVRKDTSVVPNPLCSNVQTEQAKQTFKIFKERNRREAAYMADLANQLDSVDFPLDWIEQNNTAYSIFLKRPGTVWPLEKRPDIFISNRGVSCCLLLQRLLECVKQIHEAGYLHLDISPDNIYHSTDGGDESILKLIDFNSMIHQSEVSDVSTFYTFKKGFSAPELFLAKYDQISIPTDMFSVAATFYYWVSGKTVTPMNTQNPSTLRITHYNPLCADLPDIAITLLNDMIQKGLSNRPEKRFQYADEFRQALDQLTECVLFKHHPDTVSLPMMQQRAEYLFREDDPLHSVLPNLSVEISHPDQSLINVLSGESHDPFMLSGIGGSGKSTLIFQAIKTLLNDPAATRVPLYIPLNEAMLDKAMTSYPNQNINPITCLAWKRYSFYGSTDGLHSLQKAFQARPVVQPQYIVFLDDIQKTHNSPHFAALKEAVADCQRCIPNVQLVITCRDAASQNSKLYMTKDLQAEEFDAAALGISSWLHVQPLTHQQISSCLSAHLQVDVYNRFFASETLMDILKLPLYVSMLVSAYSGDIAIDTVPSTAYEILSRAFADVAGNHDLQNTAYLMVTQNQYTFASSAIDSSVADRARAVRMLSKYGDDNMCFSHDCYRDLMAAQYIATVMEAVLLYPIEDYNPVVSGINGNWSESMLEYLSQRLIQQNERDQAYEKMERFYDWCKTHAQRIRNTAPLIPFCMHSCTYLVFQKLPQWDHRWDKLSLRWILLGCEIENSLAQGRYAFMLLQGVGGVTRNPIQAVAYF